MDGMDGWLDALMALPPLQALLISLWHSNAASEDELQQGRGKGGLRQGFFITGRLSVSALDEYTP